MTVEFLAKTKGLEVTLRDLSTDLPAPDTFRYEWDFGDGSLVSNEQNPVYEYEELGEYIVTLSIVDEATNEVLGSNKKLVRVSDRVKTMLSDTIYKLIDTYIPKDIFGDVPISIKQQLIEKWQLYLQPIVNHCVPVSEFNNELYYEALENQLIMELAAYDFLLIKVKDLIGYSTTKVVKSSTTTEDTTPKEVVCNLVYELIPGEEPDTYTRGRFLRKEDCKEIEPWCKVTGYTTTRDTTNMWEIDTPIIECGTPEDYYSGQDNAGGSVKKIVTGPTEVEYFDQDAHDADLVNYAYNALKPGGLIDILRQNLCMLAERLQIYLPICRQQSKPVVPRVVNRRRQGPLSGPDPIGPIIH